METVSRPFTFLYFDYGVRSAMLNTESFCFPNYDMETVSRPFTFLYFDYGVRSAMLNTESFCFPNYVVLTFSKYKVYDLDRQSYTNFLTLLHSY